VSYQQSYPRAIHANRGKLHLALVSRKPSLSLSYCPIQTDGDRRGFPAVDHRGEVFAVCKWAGIKTKEVRARLTDEKTCHRSKKPDRQGYDGTAGNAFPRTNNSV